MINISNSALLLYIAVERNAEIMFVVVIALEKATPSRLPTSYIEMGWAGCILIKSSMAALKKVFSGP